MIKYSSIDIIKRAEQLADLENSDFISNYEKLALLNENWTMLYQKIINSGDKTFIKKLSVCNGMKLPPDFYQLSDIYTKQGHMPVIRCNALQQDGYDIVDGRFVLSKNYNAVEVIVEYYPAPKTLYLKNKMRDSDYELGTVACNGSLYYTEDRLIKDLYDPDIRAEAQFESDNVAMFDNAAINYDYVEKEDVKEITIDTEQGYNLDYCPNYKIKSDEPSPKYYDGCKEGHILGEDISVYLPETPVLTVSEYPTLQSIIDAGYCPHYICNNTVGQIRMRVYKVLAMTGRVDVGNLTLGANLHNYDIGAQSSDYSASYVTLTYKGVQHRLDNRRDTGSRFIYEYKENDQVIFSFTDSVGQYYFHTYSYTNNTSEDISVSDLVFHYVDTANVWLPTIGGDEPFTWIVSSDSVQSYGGFDWMKGGGSDKIEPIPDTVESSTSGWSSKELAMQVFLYDSASLATAFQESNEAIPFIIDNVLYVMNKNTNEIYDFYGNKYDTLQIAFDSVPAWIYANKGYDTLYAVYDSQIFYYNRLEKVASYNCDEFQGKGYLNGKDLYAVTTGHKLIKCRNKVDILETKNVPVTIIDGSNVLTHKTMTNRYFVEGTVENTVLDFSNNISYIMLSYLLAIAFKSKQGADTTLLTNQLAVAEQQFYDSINKDINEQYTIKNVYKNRRFL